MPFKDAIRDTFLLSMPLTPIDHKVLETLISMKSGSAYSIRKVSGLKHYPTVLRSLKKLEKKGCVEVVADRMGGRSTRLHVPTVLGKLTHHLLKEESAQVTKTVALNSPLFQDMVNSKVQEVDVWAYFIARMMLYDIQYLDREKPRTVDVLVKDHVRDNVRENLLNVQEDESIEEIMELAKVKWIRELTIEEIESQIDWEKKQVAELRKLKETLVKK